MIIAIVNQKGGTGKTTTTVNLGAAIASTGRSVLLVDMDAQGSLSYSLGVSTEGATVSDIIENSATFDQVKVEREQMHIIPSDTSLADVELDMKDMPQREFILKKILAPIAVKYDFVLIDCPPSLSLLTINALTAADRVLIPLQLEVLGLQGLDLISETIDQVKEALNDQLQVLGILPVMVDKRRKLTHEVQEHISSNYPYRIFDTSIRPNVRASEAPSFGQSVIAYAEDSNSAKDYMDLANEVLKIV